MPDRAAGEHRALVVEPAHQHVHALVEAAEHVLLRHLAVLEDELAGVRAAHAELVELLRGEEALHAALDDERRDPARARRAVGLAVDDQRIGVGTVGDPHLAAVQDVGPVPVVGAEPHPDDVRARARLAHRERADVLARDQLRQVGAPLRFGAVAADLVHAQVRVRAVRQPDRRRRAADLLHRDDVREVAEPGAAVLLLDGDAEEAERAHLRPEVHRERVRPVDLRGARRDLGRGEVAHRAAEHGDRLAVVEGELREVDHRDGGSEMSGAVHSGLLAGCRTTVDYNAPPHSSSPRQ